MIHAEARDGKPRLSDIAELHRQICEIGTAISNPDIYNLLLSASEEMERRVYGKPIRGGWTEALSEARKGTTNLRLICAELLETLSKDQE